MDIVKTMVRPHLRRRRSAPNLGHREPRTEIIGLVVPENAVAVLLQAPATRRLMVETQYGAAALSAAFAEAAFVENAIKQRETAIGIQAVEQSAEAQAHAMRSHADNCRATMRARRSTGQSELQISNLCSIRLIKCWKSHIPLPEILHRLVEKHYLDFRKLSQQILNKLWRNNRDAYQVLIAALSEPETRCRWKDPSGTVRTTSPITVESEMNGVASHGTYVFDDTGMTTELTYDQYTFEMRNLKFSTILALEMHRRGDFENFGRIVATKPETVWTEMKGLKEGAIFEEEGMHTILNVIVGDIIKSPGRQDSLNRRYLARDMFQHFTKYQSAPPPATKHSQSPWVKIKVHNPKETGQAKVITKGIDEQSPQYGQYMERSLALDNLGSLAENIYGSALLTAIVATGALRYASALKKEDQQEKANLHFYLGLIFSGLKAGLDAAPVAGKTAGDIVMMLQDTTFYLIDHSSTWNHRDISDIIVQCLISVFYNPAIDGVNVPGLGTKVVCVESGDVSKIKELERRMELGRHYAELSHRYLADLLPNLTMWSSPAPRSYIPH